MTTVFSKGSSHSKHILCLFKSNFLQKNKTIIRHPKFSIKETQKQKPTFLRMGQPPSRPSHGPVSKITNSITDPISDQQTETEGAIKSESLITYKYPPPLNWAEKTSKEKAKLGCKFVFEKLGEQDKKFRCYELGENPSCVCYKITRTNLINDDEPFKDILCPIDSIRIFAWCHFRLNGKLPYYKEYVFTKSWIRLQWKKFKGDVNCDYLPIISVVSVVDKTNEVHLYIVDRTSLSLRRSSWILHSMFSLFESPQDRLQSEQCFLLQTIYSAGSRAKPNLQKRLETVESELQKIRDEEKDPEFLG